MNHERKPGRPMREAKLTMRERLLSQGLDELMRPRVDLPRSKDWNIRKRKTGSQH